MTTEPAAGARLVSVRPLVRYVDDQQAVVEIHVVVDWQGQAAVHVAPEAGLSLEINMAGPDESVVNRRVRLSGLTGAGMVRFAIEDPLRWWPAGMGGQPLYELTIKLLVGDTATDGRRITLGLNSIRPLRRERVSRRRAARARGRRATTLLVNGSPCTIQSVIQVEPLDEHGLLPVGGDSLLVVRGHFGPDELYDAADRAGIMLVQSIGPDESPEAQAELTAQVDRLVRHPSLAGWLVDKVDQMAGTVIKHLHELDPGRNVFRRLPRN